MSNSFTFLVMCFNKFSLFSNVSLLFPLYYVSCFCYKCSWSSRTKGFFGFPDLMNFCYSIFCFNLCNCAQQIKNTLVADGYPAFSRRQSHTTIAADVNYEWITIDMNQLVVPCKIDRHWNKTTSVLLLSVYSAWCC